jgi:hypothetical protein
MFRRDWMRNGGDVDESPCQVGVSRLVARKGLQWGPGAIEIRVQRIGEPGSGVGWEGAIGEE